MAVWGIWGGVNGYDWDALACVGGSLFMSHCTEASFFF